MLLDRLVTDPFRRLWQRLHQLLCPGAAARMARDAVELSAEHEEGSSRSAEDGLRISFDRALPSVGSLLRRIFQRLTLQVPPAW